MKKLYKYEMILKQVTEDYIAGFELECTEFDVIVETDKSFIIDFRRHIRGKYFPTKRCSKKADRKGYAHDTKSNAMIAFLRKQKNRRFFLQEDLALVEKAIKEGNSWQDNNKLVGQWRRTNIRIHADQEKCTTLTANMGTGGNNVPFVTSQYMWRPLTVRECARCQGIPEKYEFVTSKSRSYKCIGNGWERRTVEHNLYHLLSA